MLYSRLRIVIGIFAFLAIALVIRLYYAQIISYDKYTQLADILHWGGIKLPAQRGEIMIHDKLTGEAVPLATNANLELLYFDPKFMLATRRVAGIDEQIGDPETVVRELTPILYPVFLERKKEIIERDKALFQTELPGNRYFVKQGNTTVEMTGLGGQPLEDWRRECIMRCQDLQSQLKLVNNLAVIQKTGSGVAVDSGTGAYLSQEQWDEITKGCESECQYTDPRVTGSQVEEYGLDAPINLEDDPLKPSQDSMMAFRDWLRQKIYQNQDKRYVPIMRRLPPEVSIKIDKLGGKVNINFKGVVRLPEPWRYYPEDDLAASVIGFTDHDKIGRYGVEEQHDVWLQGKDGRILTEKDTAGREIAIGEKIVERAQDGVRIELSIDRSVQSKIEEILKRNVEKYAADSGQVIIMEPDTGRIISMAQYPSFDPNKFWDVYQRRYLTDLELQKISGEWQENHRYYPILEENLSQSAAGVQTASGSNLLTGNVTNSSNSNLNSASGFSATSTLGSKRYYVYQNALGPAVYRNKSIDEVWEPGSIFKSLIVAAALDTHAVTPDTRCDICGGPVRLDEYEVHTWNDKYRPNQTVAQTLQWSDNVGMVFVAQKLGKKMMWRYIKDFGLGERTGIGFDSEQKGVVPLWRYLADIEHATLAFGQGISVTSMQMITAFTSLVNGGYLMQPYLIDRMIYPDGKIEETEPKVRRRVIADETSAIISSMMVSDVEIGGSKFGGVKGYYVGGKTGTAQIPGFYVDKKGVKRYGYEDGVGTTEASFVGFAPLKNPRFTMLVKFDRPRENEWGSTTAAPAFSEIAEFLLKDYYRVPPER
ncbi:MAG: penicillin-binding protein 2 [Patescibacteria group bacterium]|nr:penicillin-binding protein 2 [Patescibacteria group bacterium]